MNTTYLPPTARNLRLLAEQNYDRGHSDLFPTSLLDTVLQEFKTLKDTVTTPSLMNPAITRKGLLNLSYAVEKARGLEEQVSADSILVLAMLDDYSYYYRLTFPWLRQAKVAASGEVIILTSVPLGSEIHASNADQVTKVYSGNFNSVVQAVKNTLELAGLWSTHSYSIEMWNCPICGSHHLGEDGEFLYCSTHQVWYAKVNDGNDILEVSAEHVTECKALV